MKPHDWKPFVVYRASEAIAPIASWDGCSLEDLFAEPTQPSSNGAWLAAIYQRLVVASTGPVAVGKLSTRLDAASWFHAALGADLDAARKACWPAFEAVQALGIGVGSLAPKLVLVGEFSGKGIVPFHSVVGGVLWRALRLLGWDELACYVTNAYSVQKKQRPRGKELRELHAAFDPYQPQWVALGQSASLVLAGAGIVHVQVDGPAYWHKIRSLEGAQGYSQHLTSQGVAFGAWHGQALPTVPIDGEVEDGQLLASRLGLPISVAYKPARGRKRGTAGKGIQDAHRYYVTGAGPNGQRVDTIKQAAELAGASSIYARQISRRDKWEAEREAQQQKTLAKAKEKASDVEAQKIATCRGLAWSATALGLGSVVRRLQNPDGDLAKEIDPRQVWALGKLALSISQLGDPATSDELKRVQQLSGHELLHEYKKVLGAFGVEDEEKKA